MGFWATGLLARYVRVSKWVWISLLQTRCAKHPVWVQQYLDHNFPFLLTKQHIHGSLSTFQAWTLPSLWHPPCILDIWDHSMSCTCPTMSCSVISSALSLLSWNHFPFLPSLSKSYLSLILGYQILLDNNLFYFVIPVVFLLNLKDFCFISQLFNYLAYLLYLWPKKKNLVSLTLSSKMLKFVAFDPILKCFCFSFSFIFFSLYF